MTQNNKQCEVWVIVRHAREPNELVGSSYWSSECEADTVARQIITETQCRSAAVEVRRLAKKYSP